MARNKRQIVQMALRLVAHLATLVAVILVQSQSIRVKYFGLIFGYFNTINWIASSYICGVSFFIILKNESLPRELIAIAFDLVLMVLLWSSCSAAMTVLYLEMNGNSHAYWIPICSRVHSYCVHTLVAIYAGYVGALAYLVLHLLSIQETLDALHTDQ